MVRVTKVHSSLVPTKHVLLMQNILWNHFATRQGNLWKQTKKGIFLNGVVKSILSKMILLSANVKLVGPRLDNPFFSSPKLVPRNQDRRTEKNTQILTLESLRQQNRHHIRDFFEKFLSMNGHVVWTKNTIGIKGFHIGDAATKSLLRASNYRSRPITNFWRGRQFFVAASPMWKPLFRSFGRFERVKECEGQREMRRRERWERAEGKRKTEWEGDTERVKGRRDRKRAKGQKEW